MKVKYIDAAYISFEEVQIGEIFEVDGILCLKVDHKHAFDIFNNRLQCCKGWDNLILKESELIVY